MKTKIQTFIIALAIMITLTSGSSMVFGQNNADKQSSNSIIDEQGNALVGVWESVAPLGVDCQTGKPFGPNIRAIYNIAQGGTMTEENTDEINDGPYRTTGHGIWKRISGRHYTAAYMHYSFLPDRTFVVIVKVRTNIKLSRDASSFTENGTVEVLDRDGNPLLDDHGNPIQGCFSATSTRLNF